MGVGIGTQGRGWRLGMKEEVLSGTEAEFGGSGGTRTT